jgi:multidrug resistance efflux pump
LTTQVETEGEVFARTRTTLVSEVSGVITSISENFVAGGAFSAGDTLVTIDDRNYVAEVERAKAGLTRLGRPTMQ